MPIPTEPIGSIPRLLDLLVAMSARARGEISRGQLLATEQAALRDTIALFAFAKIKSRVEGTSMASRVLGV